MLGSARFLGTRKFTGRADTMNRERATDVVWQSRQSDVLATAQEEFSQCTQNGPAPLTFVTIP